MNRIAIPILILALTLAAVADDKKANVLMQAAQAKETVQGDLKAAIELYRQAAKEAGANRALSAKALMRMAECYQKAGDAESRKIYELIVRDYADQKDLVTEARAKLGGAGAVSMNAGDRPVWTGDADGFGTISPDGRFLTYTDWKNGGLVMRTLSTGTERRLTAGTYADGQTQFSVISKDGKQVAYQWLPTGKQNYELRVASLLGTGFPESKLLFASDEYKSIAPYDWSADGKWLAVFAQRQDQTGRIGIVSTANGTLRVLKSVDWKGPIKIFFSPDSRFIAYDLKASESGPERHIFVMPVEGNSETAAVVHPSGNFVMGWSPDGSYLLFGSDRSGSMGLWGVPVANGKPRGPATLLRAGVGSSWSLGTTKSGALYTWKSTPRYVGVTPIDLNGGKSQGSSAAPLQMFIDSRGRPDWSRDGKELAYSSCAPLGGGPCKLLIRTMDTGKTRELYPQLQFFFFPRFSPDGRSLITRGTDLKGRQGAYRIDAQTGEASLVTGAVGMPQWSADGKAIYWAGRGGTLMRRDLATGEERPLLTARPDFFAVTVSPDGKHIAAFATDDKTYQSLLVMPIEGGEPRTLLRAGLSEYISGDQGKSPAWTPDSRALVIIKGPSSDRSSTELWSVPIDGSQPRKLDIDTDNWTGDGFRLSPDGRQIAFAASAGKPKLEIWAIENFLPAKTTAP